MTPRDAFTVGYLTAYVGIPFRGLEILAALVTHTSGELADAISAQMNHLRSKNAQTVDSVRQVTRTLESAGLTAPDKPYTYADYERWSRASRDLVATSTSEGTPEEAALWIGHAFATFLATLVIESLMLGFWVRAYADAALRMNAHAARVESQGAQDRLAGCVQDQRVPLGPRTIAQECLDLARRGLATSDDARSIERVIDRAAEVSATLRYANGRISELEAVFG